MNCHQIHQIHNLVLEFFFWLLLMYELIFRNYKSKDIYVIKNQTAEIFKYSTQNLLEYSKRILEYFTNTTKLILGL